MPYRFIPEEATADVAFEATGRSLEEVFQAAAAATLAVMVDNPEAVGEQERRSINLEAMVLDLLLFDLLQQLVYYKDADRLLLRIVCVEIEQIDNKKWRLTASAAGDRIDPERHHLGADVKAVTLHEFSLEHSDKEWRAHVILDI
jgi:SHS2 domain-containing protein